MVVSISGYLFLFVGLLVLALPLMLVEISRPRDWLTGGLFLFLGLFLLVENELLRGTINLLVISMAILYGKMIVEIISVWNYVFGICGTTFLFLLSVLMPSFTKIFHCCRMQCVSITVM